MSRHTSPKKLEVLCPCCGATLTIDAELGKGRFPSGAARGVTRARIWTLPSDLLKKEAERREALFRQSSEDHKNQSDLLERKFREAFEKTKDQPTTKPLRDFDLD